MRIHMRSVIASLGAVAIMLLSGVGVAQATPWQAPPLPSVTSGCCHAGCGSNPCD